MDKKIGIWGFGKTGQSVLSFLFFNPDYKNSSFFIFESQQLSPEQKEEAKKHAATFVDPSLLHEFLNICDSIIPSPGIDISNYSEYQEKFICELDLFTKYCTTKTIAITGSVGKTSIVTLLTELMNRSHINSCYAGNIGVPMLNVLQQQQDYDYIVLELSSFQLEHAKHFAPTIAVITNLYENHLDRHKTMFDYAQAKARIFMHQSHDQELIIPQDFLDCFINFTANQKVLWLSSDHYAEYNRLSLSLITFNANWNIIFAILEMVGIDTLVAIRHTIDLAIPEHRFEYVKTYSQTTFYNDSKATIPEATLESLDFLNGKPVILFLGGVSKGIDRIPFIKKIPKHVKHVICFGKEADMLHAACIENNLKSTAHKDFASAWQECVNIMAPYDVVLFSPAGASFDLFKNYEERGNAFKAAVRNLNLSMAHRS